MGIQFLNKQRCFAKHALFFYYYGNDNLKFRIESHVKTEKHTTNRRLLSRQQLSFSSSSSENNDYFADLTVAFMKANIPLNTVENSAFKEFLEKYTVKKTPSQSLSFREIFNNRPSIICKYSILSYC